MILLTGLWLIIGFLTLVLAYTNLGKNDSSTSVEKSIISATLLLIFVVLYSFTLP